MKSALSSRWRSSARFAASAELFFTRTPSNGSARSHLRTSASSTRIWFPFAPINFTGQKARGCFSSKSPLHPDPILFGGGHENERRAGTENLAGIIGLVAALENFVIPPVFDNSSLKPLADKLIRNIQNIDGCEFVSPKEGCLANTVSFVVRGADSIALLAGLDVEGVCASSGSACSAGSLEPSHVIVAIRQEGFGKFSRSLFPWPRFHRCWRLISSVGLLPEVVRRAQLGK